MSQDWSWGSLTNRNCQGSSFLGGRQKWISVPSSSYQVGEIQLNVYLSKGKLLRRHCTLLQPERFCRQKEILLIARMSVDSSCHRRVLGSRNTRGRGNSRWSEKAHGAQDMRRQRWCDIKRFWSGSFYLFGVFFLSVLLSPWHTKVIREEEPQMRKKMSIDKCKCVGHFCWLLIWEGAGHSRLCHSWAGGPGLGKEANFASHGEQIDKLRSFRASAPVRPPVPTPNFLHKEL